MSSLIHPAKEDVYYTFLKQLSKITIIEEFSHFKKYEMIRLKLFHLIQYSYLKDINFDECLENTINDFLNIKL